METQALPNIKRLNSDDRILIVEYFLNLFKLRKRAPKESRTGFSLIDVKNSEYIYKLNVLHGKQRLSRRMSIYQLSENSGSKSNCFRVVYDTLFVIKIPPFPIKSFEEYINDINAERHIVEALAPDIECISPRVSTLLKKIAPFSHDVDMEPEKFEQKCIQRLRAFPQLQKYLQIGGTFAFFMDLSKHRFLSQVIDKIHDSGNKMEKEIIGQVDSLWDLMVFEDIYGMDTAPVFYRINDVYRNYESRLAHLLRKHRQEGSVSIYEKKEWFLNYLAGKASDSEQNIISQEFIVELNCLMENIFKENYDTIEEYRKIIEKYIYKLRFKQNKPKLQLIITKILSILDRLHQKGVAIRDLKPDNIFVAERNENTGIISAHPSDLSIGLIDFETAVRFKSKYDNKIEQPLLAGTPSYATPSHLFPNELLCDAFQDLSRIFHIQDWQAVIAIIYSISTQQHLSEKTGRVLPGIIKIMRSTEMKNMTLTELFKKGSHSFWCTAVREFKEKLRTREDMLKSLIVTLPHNVKLMLKREINFENDRVNKIIWKQVDSQNIFKSRKSRKILIEASCEVIGQYKLKCESGRNTSDSKTKLRKLTVKFFQKLEYLKLQSQQLAHTIALLDQRPTTISVYELLELMFNIVLKAMYLEDWGNMSLVNEQFTDNDLYAETVMIEKTLL
ncbi:serine/threonine-protein kinase [Desulfococcaceae bacterium HSG7]|nr:serine/threonine-protein kinase [Desulfococcaceae bacterium HSG7]